MNSDNFSYTFHGETGSEWNVVMSNGNLVINEVSYEKAEDDPTYDFAIQLYWALNP
jgi:hypothetical protein